MSEQPEALRLADECDEGMVDFAETAAELRRLYNENEQARRQRDELLETLDAFREANEKFAQRQDWWNERMVELQAQRDELLDSLMEIELSNNEQWRTDCARAAIAKAEGKQ